jgi:hypothetical protein
MVVSKHGDQWIMPRGLNLNLTPALHPRLQVPLPIPTMTSQSPPRQTEPIHDSPVRVKNVHSNHAYQSDLLEGARLAVLEDLGSSVPMIPFQTFMDHLAPPQPDFDLDKTMISLK